MNHTDKELQIASKVWEDDKDGEPIEDNDLDVAISVFSSLADLTRYLPERFRFFTTELKLTEERLKAYKEARKSN